MPVYRVWRSFRAECFYVETDNASEAVEAVSMLFPDMKGWRAEPDRIDFLVVRYVVFDKDGNAVE